MHRKDDTESDDVVYVVMSKETDTNVTDQSKKKSIYCTDVLFLILFIGFTSYDVSIMVDITLAKIIASG